VIKALGGSLLLALVVFGPRPAAALSYLDVSSDVTLTQTAVNTDFILQPYYRVIETSIQATNTGANTLTDVKFVVPFAWAVYNPIYPASVQFAYSWVDANGQWESSAVTGKDGIGGVFARPVDSSDFAAIVASAALGTMLMSDTDLALSDSYYSPTATVLSTDDVPAWDIAATMAPSDVVNFKIYIQVERDNQIASFWVNGSPVAIPEPGTASLLVLGLAALAWRRRLHCK
jgi:hypothetical protein